MRVIILIEKYGNHCNQLFQSLHFHAYCLERKAIFINLSLLGTLHFENKLFKLFASLNNFFLPYISKLIISNKKNEMLLGNRKNYIKFVKGWNFRVEPLTKKYYFPLKEIYQFKEKKYSSYSLSIKKFFKDLKIKKKYIVGLHIRRGDYKTWNNGKYFFSDDVYNQVILKCRFYLKKENKDPFFVVVSDEDISDNIFYDYKINGTWKEDQIALQNCDLLLGPPSTFTMWASFLSRIPLISLDEFGRIDFKRKYVCYG